MARIVVYNLKENSLHYTCINMWLIEVMKLSKGERQRQMIGRWKSWWRSGNGSWALICALKPFSIPCQGQLEINKKWWWCYKMATGAHVRGPTQQVKEENRSFRESSSPNGSIWMFLVSFCQSVIVLNLMFQKICHQFIQIKGLYWTR